MDILGVIGATRNAISFSTIENAVRNIELQYSQISEDFSLSHINSAMQSLDSFMKSNNRTSELSAFLGHLRDSYNILESYRDKMTTNSFIFGIIKEEDFLYKHDRRMKMCIIQISILNIMAMVYEYLNEPINTDANIKKRNDLKEVLINITKTTYSHRVSYEQYKRGNYIYGLYDEIIDHFHTCSSTYVYSRFYKEKSSHGSGAHWDYYYFSASITNDGRNFLEQNLFFDPQKIPDKA